MGKRSFLYKAVLNWGGCLSRGLRLRYGFISVTNGGNLAAKWFGTRPFTNVKYSSSLCLFLLSFNGMKPVSLCKRAWLVPRTDPDIVRNASICSSSNEFA